MNGAGRMMQKCADFLKSEMRLYKKQFQCQGCTLFRTLKDIPLKKVNLNLHYIMMIMFHIQTLNEEGDTDTFHMPSHLKQQSNNDWSIL